MRPRTRLARQLVEHERVALVGEEEGGDRERYPRPEVARRRSPADDRASVKTAIAGSAKRPPKRSSDSPVEERRDRRAEEHRPRQEDVVVEELDVREEVLVQVAASLQRPGDRTDRVHGQCDRRRRRARRAASTRGSRATRGDARMRFRFLVAMESWARLASLSGWWRWLARHRDDRPTGRRCGRPAGLRWLSAVAAVGSGGFKQWPSLLSVVVTSPRTSARTRALPFRIRSTSDTCWADAAFATRGRSGARPLPRQRSPNP